jgi:hypothetical protein
MKVGYEDLRSRPVITKNRMTEGSGVCRAAVKERRRRFHVIRGGGDAADIDGSQCREIDRGWTAFAGIVMNFVRGWAVVTFDVREL